MSRQPPSFTPTSGDVYFATPKQVLVSKDPVFVRKDVVNGHYIGQKPPNYMLLAILLCVINPICGPIAVIFAVMSDRAYYAGDLRYAEKWGEYAFTACIFIFIATVVLGIAIGFSLSTIGVKGGHSY